MEKLTMQAKNRIPLYSLFTTSLISVTGDVMAALAVPWFVLQTTGSPTQTGIAAFFGIVPIVLAMIFGGTLVDRIGYKRVSVLADLASGLTMLMIPLLHLTIGLQFWQLLLLVFLGNLLDAPGGSARQAMLPELADEAGMSIERASGFSQALSRATRMLGAPLAGFLIAYISAPYVLLINAITFFISAISIQLLVPNRLFRQKNEETAKTSYWQDLRAGFAFVKGDSLLLSFIGVVMLTNMVDVAMSGVTYPYYFQEIYGSPINLGLLMGVWAASALVGTLLYSWQGEKFSRRWVFTIAFMLCGIKPIVMAFFPPFGYLLLTAAVLGMSAGPLNPIIMITLYARVPEAMRARVYGFTSAGAMVAMPLGALVAGYLLEWIGLQAALLLYGALYIIVPASLIFNSHAAAMDNPVETAQTVS
jgi:MFS family permease